MEAPVVLVKHQLHPNIMARIILESSIFSECQNGSLGSYRHSEKQQRCNHPTGRNSVHLKTYFLDIASGSLYRFYY